MSSKPVLEVRNLKKYFDQGTSIVDTVMRRKDEQIQAVDDVSLTLHANDSQGVIGESGCGKTTLLNTLMGIYSPTAGEIVYKGKDVSDFSRADWKDFRSNVQIIFQDPFNSLNPQMTIENSLKEPLVVHDIDDKEKRVRDVLREVELRPPEKYLDNLPKQLSGGEKQRVAIARALILEPDIILADEPSSMLDVSTQASLLKLLSRLREERDLSMFYISHDLSTVAYVCDTIHVMYLGRIVESAPTLDLLENPAHPYTQALLAAIPLPDPDFKRERTQLKGSPRDPIGIGEGCRFRDRCPDRMGICDVTPENADVEDGHHVACHLYYDHSEYVEGSDFDDYEGVHTVQGVGADTSIIDVEVTEDQGISD